jgi:hypothetical protein
MDLTPTEIATLKAWYGWPRFDTTIDVYCRGLSSEEIAVARDYIQRIEDSIAASDTAYARGNIKRAEEVEFFGPSGMGLMTLQTRRLLNMLAQFLGFRALVNHFGNPNCTTTLG